MHLTTIVLCGTCLLSVFPLTCAADDGAPSLADVRRTLQLVKERFNQRREYGAMLELNALVSKKTYLIGVRGSYWMQLRKHGLALTDLDRSIRDLPENVGDYVTRAAVWHNLEYYDLALADLTRAFALKQEAFILRNRADTYGALGEYKKAQDDLAAALRMEPENRDLATELAKVIAEEREVQETLDDLAKEAEGDLLDGPLLRQSYVLAAQGRLKEALVSVNAHIKRDPNAHRGYDARAGVWHRMREFRKEAKDLAKAGELAPEDGIRPYFRGRAYASAGMYREAVADFEKGRRQPLTGVKSSASLAWLLATCPNGDIRDAGQALGVIKEAQEFPASRLHVRLGVLAAAHAETGDFEKAVKYQQQALAAAKGIETGGDGHDRYDLGLRLALYRKKKPFRDHPPEIPTWAEAMKRLEGK